MAYAIRNGTLIAEEDAVIPLNSKGYFFDFTVYSSLKVVGGKLFFPEFHVDRLLDSAKRIELLHPFSRQQLISWLNELVVANRLSDHLIRVLLIGDPDNGDAALFCAFVVGGLTFYPDSFYTHGVKVITYAGERLFPQSKTKNLLLGFLALREATKQGALEALLVDQEGSIREGTRSNFYALRENTIICPPADLVLEGITKKFVLEAVQGTFAVQESRIFEKNIDNYEEFFLTSTSMNVMPISQINGEKVSGTLEATKIIQKLFRNYYRQHVLKQK